mmetsp:Transcript_19658/g.36943  ORF Transcript_19658/g.36943 Transcript_19658/m.36943 type:complete len:117 (-) Transcript_19658:36-386(-)
MKEDHSHPTIFADERQSQHEYWIDGRGMNEGQKAQRDGLEKQPPTKDKTQKHSKAAGSTRRRIARRPRPTPPSTFDISEYPTSNYARTKSIGHAIAETKHTNSLPSLLSFLSRRSP